MCSSTRSAYWPRPSHPDPLQSGMDEGELDVTPLSFFTVDEMMDELARRGTLVAGMVYNAEGGEESFMWCHEAWLEKDCVEVMEELRDYVLEYVDKEVEEYDDEDDDNPLWSGNDFD